jgi:hypothetical protein
MVCSFGLDVGEVFQLRLSATRALVAQFGADLAPCTGDDGVFLLDDLGGTNTVTPIELGSLCPPWMVRLSDDTAAVTLQGGAATVLLSGLGATNDVTSLGASSPWLTVLGPDRLVVGSTFVELVPGGIVETPLVPGGWSHPVVLDPTRLLVPSAGPDTQLDTDDDLVHLFRNLGPGYERVDLAAPFLDGDPEIVRLSPTRALVSSNGPDGDAATPDDGVLLLDQLGGAPVVTPIDVPGLWRDTLVALGPDVAVARGYDDLVVLDELGGANEAAAYSIGRLAPDTLAELRTPVRIGPRAAAVATVGPDGDWPSADDQVVTLRAADAGPVEVRAYSVPYLRWRPPLSLAPAGALVESVGLHGDLDDPRDDLIFTIGTAAGAPALRRAKALNAGGYPTPSEPPQLLGNGRAVYHDWVAEDGSNGRAHHLQVIRGFAGGVRLRARKVSILPGAGGETLLTASADLSLPEPELFAGADLAVRVGDATQTIPRGAFEATATGFRYLDPTGAAGFLRRVEYDAAAGRLEIEGQGAGTGAETTAAKNLVLSLESLDLYVAQSLDGKARNGGVVYRRR